MRFHQRRLSDAVRLFERIRQLDPSYEESDVYHSYLGRTYLALGRHSDALEELSRAYELFRHRSRSLKEEFEEREFLDTLNAFSRVLRITDQSDRAQEVTREAQEYLTTSRERRGATSDHG